ncbi:hypothetical protein ACVGWG_04495 [Enterobacter asburiae]|uniref:hypothetical protein n=1 Tax=Enterobacter asburiae TaxID=61645 RepID=UPI001CC316B5|nr:hypothetical protein [Enterobacter asburiae]MDE4037485.1 hypothetical protein [Enterobacter asburiae]MDE4067571.1 hypothetical protein [Enterobacter asburiae]MDE4071869.1 hypothetical protein [Enterobacter asburiae]
MQIKLSTFIKIAAFTVSALLLIYSVYAFLGMKKKASGKIIHCTSAFDSQVNKSSLHAVVTLYLYRNKGSVQISGDYISPAGEHTPVKSVAGIIYQNDGQDYHVRFTGNKTSFSGKDLKEEFNLLVPFSFTSKNIDYVYQLQQQTDGSYLVRQYGVPLVMCKKIARQ